MNIETPTGDAPLATRFYVESLTAVGAAGPISERPTLASQAPNATHWISQRRDGVVHEYAVRVKA